MNFAHGGHIHHLALRAGIPAEKVLDFSASINPLGPPKTLRRLINRSLNLLVHYPDPYGEGLVAALAFHHGVPSEQIVAGNGSTEILYALPRVLAGRRALIPVPSYGDYQTAARREGLRVEQLPLIEEDGFSLNWSGLEKKIQQEDVVIVGQPNNPTGRLVNGDQLTALADRHPRSFFIVDEAFADFIPDYVSLIHRQRPNIIVVRSLTKFYAIPGLRLGYAMAASELANRLRAFLPPWSVGTLAQEVGTAILNDRAYAEKTRRVVARLRKDLAGNLSLLPGVKVVEGEANYLLLKLPQPGMDAFHLEEMLLKRGIAVRVCANFSGLNRHYVRVAVRTAPENKRLVLELAKLLQPDKTASTDHLPGTAAQEHFRLQG